MSDKTPAGEANFDLEQLQKLFELMEKFDVSEVNLREGEVQWRLRRGAVGGNVPPAIAPAAQSPAPPAAQPVTSAAPSPETKPAADDGGVYIKSPTVGTFYSSPSPDDPPFVKVGSKVESDTVVCLVEAMKVFNQIPAEIRGTIAEVLVENGDAIDFGQPLFRIESA
ncbi:acetyl-CoA carboxylase biotin carboxyl carrier protein [Stratiformator vulcanicus]|uniref:Biotin carboxyl carrier protein of acetyl-CoA carboxylase n=1 Tax=Stratiformator vulcanicus TaxID=2527980 RepID=A0A517QZZ0_9PLAN|nr:acetyl-CoA carboxylase biotin carboxyl carrier protein [Stratiformator vulcanicus]QDT37201.1 Acetyl-CoA biotin carboxyl carrier [Stratiformator vulcanicus]